MRVNQDNIDKYRPLFTQGTSFNDLTALTFLLMQYAGVGNLIQLIQSIDKEYKLSDLEQFEGDEE